MKYVYLFCFVAGLVFTILIAGGSDCGSLSFGQTALYSIGGMLVSLIGWAGLKRLEEAENE